MGKLYCILGKSASGKSTVEELLEKKGIKRIISTTTRPMREGEQEGVNYHYITEKEFDKLDENNLLENTIYRDWHYCIDMKYNKLDLKNNDYVCVIEPRGYEQIFKKLGKDKVYGIYLFVNDKERLLRSLHREINPDSKEICRRFLSDIDLFKDIEKKVNISIENTLAYTVVDKIYNIILKNREEKEYNIGDIVQIKRINNKEKASHLTDFLGAIGEIKSYLNFESKPKKYKVKFSNGETAYFYGSELCHNGGVTSYKGKCYI